MVSPALGAWLQHVITHYHSFEPRLCLQTVSGCRATGLQGQRQLGRNLLPDGIGLCRDHWTGGRARQFGAFLRKAGNSQVRKSAWWWRQSRSEPVSWVKFAVLWENTGNFGSFGRRMAKSASRR